MVRYQSYVICTSPRSGSTLLCGLLAATGKSGIPDSHFHSPSISDWMGCYNILPNDFSNDRALLAAIFEAALEQGTGCTGMFGLRLQRHSFGFFMQKLATLHPGFSSDVERVQAAFGNTLFIHLTRRNKLDQAISFVKATQTGLWHKAPDGTELERLSAPQDPAYDADEIARQLEELVALDEEWEAWFAREKLQPMRITYDELSDDPAEVLARILDQLGLDREIARGVRPPVAKLADANNQIWAERFLSEKRNRSAY